MIQHAAVPNAQAVPVGAAWVNPQSVRLSGAGGQIPQFVGQQSVVQIQRPLQPQVQQAQPPPQQPGQPPQAVVQGTAPSGGSLTPAGAPASASKMGSIGSFEGAPRVAGPAALVVGGVPARLAPAGGISPGTAVGMADGAAAPQGMLQQAQPVRQVVQASYPSTPQRTLALEQRVKELEALLEQKDNRIAELEGALAKTGAKPTVGSGAIKSRQIGKAVSSGFQKLSGSKPVSRYIIADPNDPIDVRLEEFYNGTGSAVPFLRINKSFYKFGESIVELDIINHKLMARTEDGWNRSKFGPIEKFLAFHENIEREKLGIMPDS